MKADDFAKYARSHSAESLRLDEVIVCTGKDLFHMNGSLRIVGDSFELDLTYREPTQPQPSSVWTALWQVIRQRFSKRTRRQDDMPQVGGFVGASQFWDITGVIENSLHFRCRTIPSSHTSSFGDVRAKGARFEVDRLLFGSEQLTHEQPAAFLHKINASRKDISGNIDEPVGVPTKEIGSPSSEIAYEFSAVIPGVTPVWSDQFTTVVRTNAYLGQTEETHRDTIMGAAADVEFSLIKQDKDMVVHMRYRKGQKATEAVARTRFDTLLAAVAFLHGCEPWHQRYGIHRGIHCVEDVITARTHVPQTTYVAMSSRLAANGADVVSAVILAMDFFFAGTATTERIKTLLHIGRQAGAAHVAFDLGMTGLCTVFEGIVDALYKEAGLAKPTIAKSPDLKAFMVARDTVVAELAAKASTDAGYKRVQSIIKSASPVRALEKAMAVADHLGLGWDEMVKPAFDAWEKERNPTAHGSYSEEKDEAVIRDRMFSKSRIAGGINLLVQKRMGYVGLAIRSRLEDDFVRLT